MNRLDYYIQCQSEDPVKVAAWLMALISKETAKTIDEYLCYSY
jgi:hypothetical protein